MTTNIYSVSQNIDECQLVKDIELRAKAVMLPAHQYLWGDMLLTGTCTRKNVEMGIEYLVKAAQQGLPAALEHLARYYAKGAMSSVIRSRRLFYA